jgi:hypothetical protein
MPTPPRLLQLKDEQLKQAKHSTRQAKQASYGKIEHSMLK